METLRSPKQLAGPALGIPSLTFRAWFEAQFGRAAWDALDKIPRLQWMDYLRWYRRVLALPVRNDHRVTDLLPRGDGLVELSLRGRRPADASLGAPRRARHRPRRPRRARAARVRRGLAALALGAFVRRQRLFAARRATRRRGRRGCLGDGQRRHRARSRRRAGAPAGASSRPATHQQGQGRRPPRLRAGLRAPRRRLEMAHPPLHQPPAGAAAAQQHAARLAPLERALPSRRRHRRGGGARAARCRCAPRPARSSSTS